MSDPYPPLIRGGAEVYAHRLAMGLQKRGHEVGAVTAWRRQHHRNYTQDGIHVQVAKGAVVPVVAPLPGLGLNVKADVAHLHNHAKLTPTMARWLRKHSRAVVLTAHDYFAVCPRRNMVQGNGRVCRAPRNSDCGRCTREPVEAVRWGHLPLRGRLELWLTDRFLLPELDCIIAPSQALADAYTTYGVPRDKIAMVHNGVPDVAPLPVGPSDTLGFIGSFDEPHKGLASLLEALRLAPHHVQLVVAGFGDAAALKQTVVRLGLGDRVRVIGRVDDIRDFYSAVGAVVVPSVWMENCSLVIQESMMHGRPVIASRIGGNPELVRDGATGWLFEPDHVHELTGAITAWADGNQDSMAAAARAHAEVAFNLDDHITRIEEVYAATLGR